MPSPSSSRLGLDARTAVVLSSGGAKGAYGLGVMRALFSGAAASTGGQPIDPGILTGTSIGAYNASYLTSRDGSAAAALESLIQIWRQRIAQTPLSCGNGFARIRGLPFQGLDLGCMMRPWQVAANMAEDALAFSRDAADWAVAFARASGPVETRLIDTFDLSNFVDPSPLYRLVASTLDRNGLARSHRKLGIIASRWRDGTPRLFDRAELAARGDFKPVLASMAIPGVLPEVSVDGEWYVDGALTVPTPLKPAIQDGADVLHVVYVDPLLVETRVSPNAGTFETMMRVFNILSAERVKSDIEFAALVNRGIELLDGLFVDGASDTELLAAVGRLPEIFSRLRSGAPRRLLTIHRYRPGPEMGQASDYLNFTLSSIDRMIELGYRDAVGHDCDENECILAGGASAARLDGRGARARAPLARGWSVQ